MIEDTSGPESGYAGKGAALAPIPVMVGRIKAALDARTDQTMMIMARIHRPAKGYSEQETMDLAGQLMDAGCDAFYLTGFSLDQQQKAKAALKKPLMVGSGGPAAEWHSKGVDMGRTCHIDSIGVGAMSMALKELKATGKFTEAAKDEPAAGDKRPGYSPTGLGLPVPRSMACSTNRQRSCNKM